MYRRLALTDCEKQYKYNAVYTAGNTIRIQDTNFHITWANDISASTSYARITCYSVLRNRCFYEVHSSYPTRCSNLAHLQQKLSCQTIIPKCSYQTSPSVAERMLVTVVTKHITGKNPTTLTSNSEPRNLQCPSQNKVTRQNENRFLRKICAY